MRLLPEEIAELNPNIQWDVQTLLQVIEEVVCDSQVSGTSAPTKEEETDRMRQAVEARDKQAEDEAIVDYLRADMREWWQDFPEQ